MLRVTIPNAEYISAGVLKTAILLAGVAPFNRPLKASPDGSELSSREAWLGKPALTSLAIRLGGIEVTLMECVITVSQERNIVTTALQGRDGTIKEYVSDGDYQVEVSAAILPYTDSGAGSDFANVEDRYPLSELQDFLALLKEKKELEVQSDFLALFDVYSAVVKSYSFAQETHSNRQAFTLTLLSDKSYEIKTSQDA